LFGDGKEWGIDIGAAGAVEPMEFLPKSHLLGLLDAVENILAPRKAPRTATVSLLRRPGLGYRTIQRGLLRSVQTQS
jgi:hypothetical protein